MKTLKTLAIGMILIGTQSVLAVENRGTEGHGGDPLTQLFNDARAYTAQRIENAQACSFTVGTNPEVVNWIMTRKFDLANDVRKSPHTWVTDSQATCAFTQTSRLAPITFSFEACRPNIREVNDAVAILAHESAHHFGIVDERFADEVGRAIQRLGQNCDCNPVPGTDPFDPNSCSGRDVSASELYSWIPLPTTKKELGSFETHIRQRTCYNERFCTTWIQPKHALVLSEKHWGVNPNGISSVRLSNNKPEFRIDAPHNGYANWSLSGQIDQNHALNMRGDVWPLFLDLQEIKSIDIKSKLTSTCYRGTVSKSRNTKDKDGNDITIETDMVILSQFK